MPAGTKRLTVSDLSRPLPRLTSRKDVHAADAFVRALKEEIRLSDNRIRRVRQASKGYTWKDRASLKTGDIVIRGASRYRLLERPRITRGPLGGRLMVANVIAPVPASNGFVANLYWSMDRRSRVKVAV